MRVLAIAALALTLAACVGGLGGPSPTPPPTPTPQEMALDLALAWMRAEENLEWTGRKQSLRRLLDAEGVLDVQHAWPAGSVSVQRAEAEPVRPGLWRVSVRAKLEVQVKSTFRGLIHGYQIIPIEIEVETDSRAITSVTVDGIGTEWVATSDYTPEAW